MNTKLPMKTPNKTILRCAAIAAMALAAAGCREEADAPALIAFPKEGGELVVYCNYTNYWISINGKDYDHKELTGEGFDRKYEWLTVSHRFDEHTYVFTAEANGSGKSRTIYITFESGDTSRGSIVRQY